jgi:glycosyltransferase involved in cell wall biosynthesis
MKVIKVINSLDFGGIEKVFEIVARYHQGDKTDVIFLALGKGGATEQAISKLGFRVIVWNVRTRIPNIGLILRLARFLRKEKPSVVHTTGAEGNFHGILAACLAGVPVRIAEEIGMPAHGKAARFIFRQVYRSAYRVIAVAGLVEKFLLDTKEVPAWKTSLIYNPVDVRAFEAIKADPDPYCFRIVSVCRLDPIKNLQLLIRGFGALDIPAELWLVGDGPARSELEALVRELGLEGRVVFHGYQSRPSEFLQKASLFVLPSFSEGLPVSAVEAMLTGTPCLATGIGGAPEFIRDGENGWLLDPKDLPGFTGLLRRISEMPAAERWEIGQKGKQTALEKFQPKTYLSELEKLYRKEERIRVLHAWIPSDRGT